MKLASADPQNPPIVDGLFAPDTYSSDGAIKVHQGSDPLIADGLGESEFNEHRSRVFEYWRSLRRDGELPLASSFDLMDVYQSAAFIVVKDVIDQGADFVNRFWGIGMSKVVGTDHTGRSLSGYYSEDNVGIIRSLYNLPLESHHAMMFSGNFWFIAGKDFVAYEALCLPCSDKTGEVSQLVTVFDYEDEVSALCRPPF